MHNNSFSPLDFHMWFKQIKVGQLQEISIEPHPFLIAYIIHHLDPMGAYILVSVQNKLLSKIQEALLFLEPNRKVFFVKETSSVFQEGLDLSHLRERHRLQLLARAIKAQKTDVFMLNPQNLMQKTTPPNLFKEKFISLKKGDVLPHNFINLLQNLAYQNRDHVEQIGEFSMRGSVLDIFCPLLDSPVRLELIGDEIILMKYFDIRTQMSFKEIQQISISPVQEKNNYDKQNSIGILDYFSDPFIWNLDEAHLLKKTLQDWKKENDSLPSFSDTHLPNWKTKQIRELNFYSLPQTTLNSSTSLFSLSPAKNFFKSPNWVQQIKTYREQGIQVFISASKKHIKQKLTQELQSVEITTQKEDLWFKMQETQQSNLQIVHLISSFTVKNLIWLQEKVIFLQANVMDPKKADVIPAENKKVSQVNFSELKSGDLVVHKQYGIGYFQQLKILNFDSNENEFLVLEYKSGNLLYVPVYALHQVQKYSGPALSKMNNLLDKLGDKKWLTTKEKVKKQIHNITLELMNLYSLRSALKRKPFTPIKSDYKKFVSEFAFTETPDQQSAINCILQDLTQKENPMDRLICGDTGFGKTEVAMRAAFKVIEDNFQVCFMAPTTLLSFQHFERLKERFCNWPISIEILNRFTPLQKRNSILQKITNGTIDILIGTHRILNRDIQFKKLGLLIIDEEHLFGVRSKEKLKNWYSKVDTISLSATPIPRSLSMSLAGFRDMSLILTPPINRKAIYTFISPFKDNLIQKACFKELNRNGQIIFIHNRISTISFMEEKLKKLLPNVRIRMAHGKMKDLQQKIVLDFFNQKFDLLLCTTIVESGMDFPKASTLFIHKPEQFGLSQLHQLRGRIGRSSRQSYCYLLIESHKQISKTAMERLKIIQENNQPGAGIMIAQYDLEMRGAGELMGEEQSGFLQDIGYEMYFEFLQENISLLKDENFVCIPEPNLHFTLEAFIPNTYIPHEKSRLIFYKKLASAQSESEINQIEKELIDFAGHLPSQTENLILLSHCRSLAKQIHIRELTHRSPWLYINLADSTPLDIPQILHWIQKGICEWKDKNTLKFHLKNDSIFEVLNLLKTLISKKKKL